MSDGLYDGEQMSRHADSCSCAKLLSDETRDRLLVAIACGLRVLLKAAAAGELNEDEVTALAQMAAHTGTVVDAALEEMGL